MSKFLTIFISAFLTLNAQANHSLSFDGVDDYVALAGKPITGFQNNFSILTKFKTNSLAAGQGIYFHGGDYKDIGLRIDEHDGLKKLHFFMKLIIK